MREHAIVVACEERQQLELLGGQANLALAAVHAARVVVDREIAGLQPARLRGVVAHAPQRDADAGEQLLRPERLRRCSRRRRGRARAPCRTLPRAPTRRQSGPSIRRASGGNDFNAIEVRQPEIEHHDIRVPLRGCDERFTSADSGAHFVPAVRRSTQAPLNRGVVFDRSGCAPAPHASSGSATKRYPDPGLGDDVAWPGGIESRASSEGPPPARAGAPVG